HRRGSIFPATHRLGHEPIDKLRRKPTTRPQMPTQVASTPESQERPVTPSCLQLHHLKHRAGKALRADCAAAPGKPRLPKPDTCQPPPPAGFEASECPTRWHVARETGRNPVYRSAHKA